MQVNGHGTGIRTQSGFSLLEVLLAATLMSTGLAGLAALMMAALGGTLEATYRGKALLFAQSMAGTIQIAPSAGAAFLAPDNTAACPVGTSCAPGQFASSAVKEWRVRISEELPEGLGLVCLDSTPADGTAAEPFCDGSGPLVVKVFWSNWPVAGSAGDRVVLVVP